MPEGVMEWFDPATGVGRIVRAGQPLMVREEDVDRNARVAGARVHFDVDHERPGEALRVTGRRGTRTRPQHHGVGRLTGARLPDDDHVAGDPFQRPVIDGLVHPKKVATAWYQRVVEGDLTGALSLCAPTAVLHTATGVFTSRSAIAAALGSWPYTGAGIEPVEVRGDEDPGTTRLRWPGWGPDRTVVVRVEHGEVVDLVVDGSAGRPADAAEAVGVEFSASGSVTLSVKQYAIDKIEHLAATVSAPVLFARVKLRHVENPASPRAAHAEAMLDVNGRAVRAHSAASTFTEAIDDLADRLTRRLRMQQHWSRSEGTPPTSGEWRHSNQRSNPTAWFDRAPDERVVVRHKAIADEPMSVDEAVFDMDILDYDFYLFTDLATGRDALVRRTADGQVELSMLSAAMNRAASAALVVPSSVPPPTLTLDEARDWLDESGDSTLFFADSNTGRGCVLYRRYDGHYGVVAPPD
jgi:ribosome-associated translation inhibitor RaiA